MKRLLILLGCILILLLIPMFLWFLEERSDLEIVIIDKTVPDETYREHQGTVWVLNHFRHAKKAIHPAKDYYGFVPNERNQTYDIRELPESYDDVDVIYMTDSYGVYEDDVPWLHPNREREGARSSLLYGGVEMKEWMAIYNRLTSEKKSTFILEFNSFASPTEKSVRDSMTRFLNIDWSGWIGRYFDELNPDLNLEIPQWILDTYADQWNYEGPGFVLVNEYTGELVVLLDQEHTLSKGIKLTYTEKGQNKFGLTESPHYQYWFDIVQAKNQDDVLAYYDWDVTEEGKALLESKNIPIQFAAVIEHTRGQSKNYYFAGDFADVANVPMLYQYKGLAQIMSFLYDKNSEKSFYWKTYVPMLDTILSESKEEMVAETSEKEAIASLAYEKNIAYNARINEQDYEVLVDGEWQKLGIKGVNLGMGKPGVFPGEAAITEEEYYRWFQYIGEMGANSIRIYTLHPPDFYYALKQYNEEHETPLYLFHGVWIEEESLVETLDAFHESHTLEFQAEMKRIVDAVHGNAVVEPNPGHAHGLYQADISEYVIGWILGIEWYPIMVKETNDKYPNLGDYQGQFVDTINAEPFEYWMAEQMDDIISYEMEKYQWMRPISFTNWVTTDLLTHPAEPNEEEDLVGVNPNVIHLKKEMQKVNQFASYHVYPYYPDFLNYEEEYVNFIDHRGEKNNYAGYLRDLHEAHEIPVLIAEFGVPGSRGLTHENPSGWNQGFLEEEEQGEIIVHLYEDIVQEGMLGGLIFTWQDEWFKRTWNTMDYDNPDRRPFWSNAQTNEQQFGLLSFDRHKIRVDGNKEDWQNTSSVYTGDQQLQALYMDHDERYLYLRLDIRDTEDLFTHGFPMILFDTIENQGNQHVQGVDDLHLDTGMDFLLYIKNEEDAAVLVDTYYDFFALQYVHTFQMLKTDDPLPTNNSGIFNPSRFALNQELYIPSQDRVIPFSYYETGKLRHGNGNPDAQDYDSLADFYVNKEEKCIEIRIPWLLLSFKDPTLREVMANIYGDDPDGGEFIEGIQVSVLYVQPTEKDRERYQVLDSLPARQNGRISEDMMKMYKWEKWQQPLYKERLKKSYDIVKKAFTSD